MRVTNAMQMENWLHTLGRTSSRLERAQVTLASGQSLQRPSDDPTGISRSIILQDQIGSLKRSFQSIDDGLAWLKTADTVLGNVTNTLNQAYETALLGANGTITDEQRLDLVGQVDQMIEQVVEMANAQYAGNYIFSGEKVKVKPFDLDSAKTGINPYAGGEGSIFRQVADENLISINYSGQEVFVDTKVFDALLHLKETLAGDDQEGIQQAAHEVQEAFKQIVEIRGVVGSRISRLEETKDLYHEQKAHLENRLGEITEGSLPEMIAALKREETAYQAALLVGARINSISLLDYLR
ncbi:MAG: flagellar hook-associated protein FlgL [Bacillota bacterium]|jgi:flagellar hook-associated protein 3 FlgL|nr:flagellar hook-associated protein FlgL [Clostridia bacterium]